MPTFKLSSRSLANLEGVNPKLVAVVKKAILLTDVDFGVIDGVRTVERQRELLRAGATQTMSSKHLTGHAVDLMAYVGSRGSWETGLYSVIAAAMRKAARSEGVSVRWGGAWQIDNIVDYKDPMDTATRRYIAARSAANRRPFVDSGHFELSGADFEPAAMLKFAG